MAAPNKELYKKISKPSLKTYWSRYLKSLEIMKLLNSENSKGLETSKKSQRKLRNKTNTVIRMTLIKNLNMQDPEDYIKLIKKANPKYIEVKAYSFIGFSRQRLKESNSPQHQEVKDFAKKLCRLSNYKIRNEKKESRIVLLTH